MAEYIDRQMCEIAAEADQNYRLVVPLRKIRKIPAADVAPVVHGRWVNVLLHREHPIRTDVLCAVCSNCKKQADKTAFCQHCGAKMDKDGTQ